MALTYKTWFQVTADSPDPETTLLHYLRTSCILAVCVGLTRWFIFILSWWRHQMETFSALQAICAGNSPVNGEFPAQRPVTRSFDIFFHLGLN